MAVATMPMPASGSTLDGRYTLGRSLGSGGMGLVFEATHLRLRTNVAIKILRPELAAIHEYQVRFEREARAAALLRSPHAVRVFDVTVSSDGLTYMVMELLEGHDLGEEAARGPIRLSDAADWIIQACSALQEAHDHKIIHRDIKSANIFLARENGQEARVAKLLDFGISKFDDHLTASVTKAVGGTLGTPKFMSPEQIRGRRLDPRTDIWSLGVVLYRILGQAWPFEGSGDSEYMAAVLADPPIPIEHVRADLPFEVASVVMRALEKRPDDRFASADELAAALAPFSSGKSVPRGSIPRTLEADDAVATLREPGPLGFESTARMAVLPTGHDEPTATGASIDLHATLAANETKKAGSPAVSSAPARVSGGATGSAGAEGATLIAAGQTPAPTHQDRGPRRVSLIVAIALVLVTIALVARYVITRADPAPSPPSTASLRSDPLPDPFAIPTFIAPLPEPPASSSAPAATAPAKTIRPHRSPQTPASATPSSAPTVSAVPNYL